MSKQLELALLSLMPAHGSELPPSLVELAGSLLAQSRNRASTLKAEEEVGRHYACANIACDRLKITLNLPPIEPRPPIPPRIYKRLYTHLDNILPNTSGTPRSSRLRTPSSKKRELGASPASSARQLPSRGTPSKESSLAQFRQPSQAGQVTPSKSTVRGDAAALKDGLHPWIRPTIRYMCAEMENRRLAPTVLAGVESIVAPAGRRTDDPWVSKHIADLAAAIYFFVIMRVRAMTSGDAIDREGYVPLRKEILGLLAQARHHVTIKDVNESEAWDGWRAVKSKEFDTAVAHVNDTDWLAGDWYKGLVDVVDSTREDDTGTAGEVDHDDSEAQLPARRADTMLQEKYDFLSESRLSDYAAWKDQILARIGQAMTAGGAMDIDS
ncbi:hypothetical protein JDV02_006385 [Purpureocillium takamizusanense]|uniref:ORC6 first cyclin-like domain-containing protein n=1 Tax=Purpureocillium takamizusanense TaxID=2060973 RepID=A0A9Q8VBA1_9HYPO|nr:uncharacterized protein JDV02_006385 [Purpureocillium takamizusanense]UNI20285.1 hypothetical protein JDV02_006385 [Purpureocillium takamizusanense]